MARPRRCRQWVVQLVRAAPVPACGQPLWCPLWKGWPAWSACATGPLPHAVRTTAHDGAGHCWCAQPPNFVQHRLPPISAVLKWSIRATSTRPCRPGVPGRCVLLPQPFAGHACGLSRCPFFVQFAAAGARFDWTPSASSKKGPPCSSGFRTVVYPRCRGEASSSARSAARAGDLVGPDRETRCFKLQARARSPKATARPLRRQ